MSIAANLRDAWLLAAQQPRGPGLRAARFAGGGNRIWATVNDDELRGLLIIVSPDENVAGTVRAVKRASTALSAEISHFKIEADFERGLHLWCNRSDLLEAFVGFCDPFVVRCVAGESLDVAFNECFEEFRRLISAPSDTATPAKLVGLLGELKVLSELVKMEPRALRYWFYPLLERHDFRNGSAAIEVKTSLRGERGSPIVTISSLDQLDPPPGGSLHLHWLRLERDSAGSISLKPLVDEVCQHVPPDDAAVLRHRIAAALEVDSGQRFALQERRTFAVRPSFPRLTPSRLIAGNADAGVGRVTYELDLSAAAPFLCPVDDANKSLVAGAPR